MEIIVEEVGVKKKIKSAQKINIKDPIEKKDESENKESVWYYQNFGINNNPTFNLISKNKFQSEMIETGKSAFPILFDYNNDGLLDLFVANF